MRSLRHKISPLEIAIVAFLVPCLLDRIVSSADRSLKWTDRIFQPMFMMELAYSERVAIARLISADFPNISDGNCRPDYCLHNIQRCVRTFAFVAAINLAQRTSVFLRDRQCPPSLNGTALCQRTVAP